MIIGAKKDSQNATQLTMKRVQQCKNTSSCDFLKITESPHEFSHSVLTKKYTDRFLFYVAKPINELISNCALPHVILFRDFMYFDDETEYLKKIYSRNDALKKMKSLISYLNNVFPEIIPCSILHEQNTIVQKRKFKITKILLTRMMKKSAANAITNTKEARSMNNHDASQEKNKKDSIDKEKELENSIHILSKLTLTPSQSIISNKLNDLIEDRTVQRVSKSKISIRSSDNAPFLSEQQKIEMQELLGDIANAGFKDSPMQFLNNCETNNDQTSNTEVSLRNLLCLCTEGHSDNQQSQKEIQPKTDVAEKAAKKPLLKELTLKEIINQFNSRFNNSKGALSSREALESPRNENGENAKCASAKNIFRINEKGSPFVSAKIALNSPPQSKFLNEKCKKVPYNVTRANDKKTLGNRMETYEKWLVKNDNPHLKIISPKTSIEEKQNLYLIKKQLPEAKLKQSKKNTELPMPHKFLMYAVVEADQSLPSKTGVLKGTKLIDKKGKNQAIGGRVLKKKVGSGSDSNYKGFHINKKFVASGQQFPGEKNNTGESSSAYEFSNRAQSLPILNIDSLCLGMNGEKTDRNEERDRKHDINKISIIDQSLKDFAIYEGHNSKKVLKHSEGYLSNKNTNAGSSTESNHFSSSKNLETIKESSGQILVLETKSSPRTQLINNFVRKSHNNYQKNSKTESPYIPKLRQGAIPTQVSVKALYKSDSQRINPITDTVIKSHKEKVKIIKFIGSVLENKKNFDEKSSLGGLSSRSMNKSESKAEKIAALINQKEFKKR